MTASLSTNFLNDFLHISMNNSILLVSITNDVFDADQTDAIKYFFLNLFNSFDTTRLNYSTTPADNRSNLLLNTIDANQSINDQNGSSRTFGCIFDIHLLSSLNLYRYAKEFKPFFHTHKELLHRVVHSSAIVVDSSLLRIVITPIINFINSGRPFTFTKNIEEATKFVLESSENDS